MPYTQTDNTTTAATVWLSLLGKLATTQPPLIPTGTNPFSFLIRRARPED